MRVDETVLLFCAGGWIASVVLYHFSSYFAMGRRERKSHNAVAFMVEKGVYVVVLRIIVGLIGR